MSTSSFKDQILAGIPSTLPPAKAYDERINHAPKRKSLLSLDEQALALRNALRYIPRALHSELVQEFRQELNRFGRIYMHRYRPEYEMKARPISDYPARSSQTAAIMLMIQNNLDPAVAQHPHELITYGGNGAVFQNWAQYRLTMKYLATMSEEQTLVMNSGHPLGLFPSHREAPRVVITNGLMIPNYSRPDDWERFNALGVTQYGQMTAGSYMYIGPQGIVHGTAITLLNAARKISKDKSTQFQEPVLFVSSGLGGMSGAQPKAAKIAQMISVVAEINPKAAEKRHEQGWVDELHRDLPALIERIKKAKSNREVVSLAYLGNIVDLWEALHENQIKIELGSDQTSLHNPYAGGYYPASFTFEEAQHAMVRDPSKFKTAVQKSLIRQVNAINALVEKGMYFFDYGNAFLLEASRAKADVVKSDGRFKYPSYVEDIMGPMCFDYGFGPFRWVCTSGQEEDLHMTDSIAQKVLEEYLERAPQEIHQMLKDNLHWIRSAQSNALVVGSQARILYSDSEGRISIALEFNRAVREGKLSAPVVLGRDHHDVSGTDSPYRETANIYDGSRFTADMATQNFVGDAFRGATWVSLHNGGGVGWGEVVNGGFGMVLDGSLEVDVRIKSMLFWDVNNGIARRSWARNEGALFTAKRAMQGEPKLEITLPELVDDVLLDLKS